MVGRLTENHKPGPGRKPGFKMDDKHREKIGASQVLNRLIKHAEGDAPNMKTSEVTAALGLLKKILPDLAAVELSGGMTHHVIAVEPMSAADWQKKHAGDGDGN